MSKSVKTQPQSMNQAFSQLEEIVNQFEEGKVELEDSLIKFKQGLELASWLKKKLKVMENEIIEIKEAYDKEEKET